MLTRLRSRVWRNLRFLSGLQERLRRRFTPTGRILLAGTSVAGLFGVDTRQTLAFQAFGLGVGLLFCSWLGSLNRPPRLRVQRHLPRYATVGEPCHYSIDLEYLGRRPAIGLELEENLPDPRPDRATFLNTVTPEEQDAYPLDRLFGYPRWRALVQRGQRTNAVIPTPLALLIPGTRRNLELTLIPRRRGVLILDGMRVYRQDPLGLMRRARPLNERGRLLVLPQRYPVPPQRPPGRRRLQPGGINLATAVGDSQEFIGLRDYRPGDAPRRIDWAAWARSGIPVVKEYQDEYFSRQALILDSFVRPNQMADFEIAVSVAASFVEPLQGNDSLLDLLFVADQAYTLTSGRGLLSGTALLEVLASVAPAVGTLASLTTAVLAHAPLINAALCILLDWDAPRQALVQRLRTYGLPVQVLMVSTTAPDDYAAANSAATRMVWINPQDPAASLRTCTVNRSFN